VFGWGEPVDKQQRSVGALLWRYVPAIGAVLLALFNGSLYSPIYDSVDQILYLFSRSSLHLGPLPLQPYRTTLFIAVMTLLIGGIPAALYERIGGLRQSTPLSASLWLTTTLLLTLPALREAFGTD
jgi:hypothetical protein